MGHFGGSYDLAVGLCYLFLAILGENDDEQSKPNLIKMMMKNRVKFNQIKSNLILLCNLQTALCKY